MADNYLSRLKGQGGISSTPFAQNRERMLPAQPAGFYREYTVRKPGESDRGPWRVIAGADGSRFWTADHYASFEEVVQP